MSSFLIYILKSTLCLTLLYGGFRLFMQKETFFALNRSILLAIIVCATIIPLLTLPPVFQPFIHEKGIQPVQRLETIGETSIYPAQATPDFSPETAASSTINPEEFSWTKLIRYFYWAGMAIAVLFLAHGIGSVLFLFRKAKFERADGFRLLIVDQDIPPFSFARFVVISKADYENHRQSILTHELAHIRLNHFFDLALLETAKIVHWFNPAIYWLISDMREIHEFQADENTLNTGIDAKQYQFLIIQKSVGSQRFALANSFNHCQIKNRITMMNKPKTGKARHWKVATFLPLLALLLMAFGKPGEPNSEKSTLKNESAPATAITSSGTTQTDRIIEIKDDGNYIANKRCSLDEISKTVKEWSSASNKWIQLQVAETVPVNRIDEILEKLGGNAALYHLTISLGNSGDIIYPAGDATLAKFKEGSWSTWLKNQLAQYTEGKSNQLDFTIKYRFVIDKTGKVSDARIVKASQSDEINAAMEKVLSQIPDWIPAKRGNEAVSVLYDEIWIKNTKGNTIRMMVPPPPPPPPANNKIKTTNTGMVPPPPPPPPLIIDIQKDGNYIDKKLYSMDELGKKIDSWKKSRQTKVVWIKAKSEVSEERIDEVKKVLSDKEMSVLDMTKTESNQ